MYSRLSGLVSRSRRSPSAFLLAGLLVGVLTIAIPPQLTIALTISDEQLAQLEMVFNQLKTANSQLQAQLNESTVLLQKASQSFNEYESAAEKTALDLIKEKQALAKQRDCWRTAMVVSVGVGVVAEAVLVMLLLLK